MAQAVRFYETGGPEVLKYEAVDLPPPSAGEVRIRHRAVGLNFIDTYHRSGLYPVPLPSGIGLEAAGVVEAVGDGVADLQPGDRVAYGTGPLGACATEANRPADTLVRIPEGVGDDVAAAIMLKGMTAGYLLTMTRPVVAGETILIHAAAGGTGLLMVQWAKHLGARVIGVVGNEDKAALARAHGCDETVLRGQQDLVARVRELTDGAGVPVVYDSVGRSTFEASLDCLAPRGMLVSFGNASGPAPAVEPGLLAAKGSLYLTRPTLVHYTRTREELEALAGGVLDLVAGGVLKVRVEQRFPLEAVADAHRALEAGRTLGATVLTP
ncbi:MAG: quinone oxidoreductase [Pseudomonadales bacterium]|jgi:NADPH2:quinone reductase|nr:quinone oxidoreductase [Pseudomonadales bacterium]